jgi:hypothetical protein
VGAATATAKNSGPAAFAWPNNVEARKASKIVLEAEVI